MTFCMIMILLLSYNSFFEILAYICIIDIIFVRIKKKNDHAPWCRNKSFDSPILYLLLVCLC